jgi:iron complex outermembrane receptor protein
MDFRRLKMTVVTSSSLKKKVLYSAITAGVSLMLGAVAQAQENIAMAPEDGASSMGIEEVVVTARRKAESAQETPVAVTALTADAIYRENITELNNLTSKVPGINFTQSGGATNPVYSIRGRSRNVFGSGLPAVNTYVNEVPVGVWGGNLPTYDTASLQVLKGPQGTLFGRNSTSGAVLVGTQAPVHEFGGYVNAKFGEYNSRIYEGAVNIPIVEDKVALRIAGQLDDRDGYTKDMVNPGEEDFGHHDRENFRISLLVEPTENFSNTMVYEKNKIDERSLPQVPVNYTGEGLSAIFPYYSGDFLVYDYGAYNVDTSMWPAFDPELLNPFFPAVECNGNPVCDVGAFAAMQEAAGPRKLWHDHVGFLKQELESFSNTTTVDFGAFTLKNIFGYRTTSVHSRDDIDGTIFPMVNADNFAEYKQLSNEIQISGEALDGALEYIGGFFYIKSEPDGPNRLVLQTVAQQGTPFSNPYLAALDENLIGFSGAIGASDYYTDTSTAFFGQVSYELSALSDSLEGLSVDIGARRTRDKAENCPVEATEFLQPESDFEESLCAENISATFTKTTYNLGLNYQITDNVLLYVANRTGYRAGGVNSPMLGGALVPFQSYDPEEVTDYEIGLKTDWSIGDIFGRFNLAVYRSEYEAVHYSIPTSGVAALIDGGVDGNGDPTDDPSGGLFTGNAGDATVEGIELDLVVQLTSNLELSLNGAYMDKELDAQVILPTTVEPFRELVASQKDVESFVFLAAPDWSYNASATYTLPLDSDYGEVAVTARYFEISEVDYGGNLLADGYDITDIRIDWYGVLGTAFDVAAYVTNVTDEEAFIGPSSSGSTFGINSGIFNEPRMWGASVRYSF